MNAGLWLGHTSVIGYPGRLPTMNVPLGAPSPIVAARLRARREIQASLDAGLERNRRAVAAHAAGGGGHQAHLNGTTTHGHIWLLPEEMRRPWRANMVGRPRTATADTSGGGSLQVMKPLDDEQLRQLLCQYAVTSADALPADECAICYEHFELPIVNQLSRQASIVRLPCGGGHTFHYRCIEPWMRKGRLCPVCRQTINPRARKAPQLARGRRASAPLPAIR